MDKDLQNLLCNLETDIDKKCFEIKQKRREKKLQRLFIIISILLLIIPSMLILLNINIWGIIFSAIVIISIIVIAMLPIALKEEVRGECYE